MSAPANLSNKFRNGNVSFWVDSIGERKRRPGLPEDLDVDVAIAGGGMTALWTAYYLKKARPELAIVVLEKDFCGFGASGRNGGWLSAKAMGFARHYVKHGGMKAVRNLQREMINTVDESVRVATAEGFGGSVKKDGLIEVATSSAQYGRLQNEMKTMLEQGFHSDEVIALSPRELSNRVNVDKAVGAMWTPHCARIHPAEFTFGLADVVERLGVKIYEDTVVTQIKSHQVVTNRGTVQARWVVTALEGYTCTIPGQKRRLLPMNSSMVITEPLAEDQLSQIGWRGAELLSDVAHNFAYIQKTADGRIALGGRGVPYNFASSFKRNGENAKTAIEQLGQRIVEMFPMLKDTKLDHSWSGVLGVPRDWSAAVRVDHDAGLIEAGGYVGHGVAGTNLAGRTVRDIILGEDTELTRLPWVGHTSRNWEFEPIRWIGATALYAMYRFADREEYRTQSPKTHLFARVGSRLSGRY